MKQALLVIDAQQSFRQRPFWDDTELPPFIAATQSLIDHCKRRDIPVVQVFHTAPNAAPNHPFARASGYVATLPELRLAPSAVFYKTVHSALYGVSDDGLTLREWLRRQGIEEILISGIRTEQCCETTARHASDDGFAVRYALDATLTFAMTDAHGRVHTPDDIRTHTAMVLEGRFARVLPAARVFD